MRAIAIPSPYNRNRRLPSVVIFLIVSLFAFLVVGCSTSAPDLDEFKGTPFTSARPAPDFTLTDQFGKPRSLRVDFDDRVTLLTFLYTECPDVCPIVANHLRDISRILDDNAPDTAIVIVSVDPINDTVDSAHAYSARWGMQDRWTYLVGSEEDLTEVWHAYFIDPYEHGPGNSEGGGEATHSGSQGGGTSGLERASRRVIHSAPIYVIDGDGMMRSAFTLPLAPEEVAYDVRLVGG